MSTLTLAAPLATFAFFLGFAAAQISAPVCSSTFVWVGFFDAFFIPRCLLSMSR
jgi:hypothetical protein